MSNMKKYILTGVILGSIAGVSAGLIGLTNLITANKIAENEKNKISLGIKNIFKGNVTISEEEKLEGYKYTVSFYSVEKEGKQYLAFKSEGSNMYGKISFISGFDKENATFMSLYLIKNEQSYASTLVENYVDPVNAGSRKVADVSCGATYGATLVKEMIEDATNAANSFRN